MKCTYRDAGKPLKLHAGGSACCLLLLMDLDGTSVVMTGDSHCDLDILNVVLDIIAAPLFSMSFSCYSTHTDTSSLLCPPTITLSSPAVSLYHSLSFCYSPASCSCHCRLCGHRPIRILLQTTIQLAEK